jgi:large subunit ribosomal protein L24
MQQATKYQVKSRLKKGDQVVIIAGSHKGETGKIDKIDRKHDRIFVAGINLVKRHTKPSMSNQEGGIVEKLAGVHCSNVALLDAKKGKATRIKYSVEGKSKSRIAKKSGVAID